MSRAENLTCLLRRLTCAALFLALASGGCADLKRTFSFTSIDEEGNVTEADLELPAKELLTRGMDDYSVGKYFTAVEFFEEILNRYPFSPEAVLAELKAADCSYHLGRYQEALLLYEEFENRHPTNESIPYVLFQRGMSNFKQMDRIDRDTGGAEKAIALFRQLVQVYPNSPYAAEARSRIAAANEFLADHEYFVVEYYVRTEKFDQAKVRLNYLLATYPESQVAGRARELLARIEAGDPPRSRLTSWFPKLRLPVWIGSHADGGDSAAIPD
jgi:outer membrane protein assembly factor BamD